MFGISSILRLFSAFSQSIKALEAKLPLVCHFNVSDHPRPVNVTIKVGLVSDVPAGSSPDKTGIPGMDDLLTDALTAFEGGVVSQRYTEDGEFALSLYAAPIGVSA